MPAAYELICNSTATKTPSHKEKVSDMDNMYYISQDDPNLLDEKIWGNDRDADKSVSTPYGDSENSVIVI